MPSLAVSALGQSACYQNLVAWGSYSFYHFSLELPIQKQVIVIGIISCVIESIIAINFVSFCEYEESK